MFAYSVLHANFARADLHVAVASNFQAPMQEILQRFAAHSDVNPTSTYGASGKFFAQINQGAPFDVFLSADQAKPQALETNGFAVTGSRFTYAIGQLSLWSNRANIVTLNPATLASLQFNKIAMANPRHAPYGIAATAVLANLGQLESTKPHWVLGENVAQAFQFVVTGNADLGFIARSQLVGRFADQGSSWAIPTNLHPPIRQDAVLLTKAKENQAAKNFLTFLRTNEIQQLIESYGYASLVSLEQQP